MIDTEFDSERAYLTAMTPAAPHARGDHFGRRRLPEFELAWADHVHKSHPIKIVGRFLDCGVHGGAIGRGMRISGSIQPPCQSLAKEWHEILATPNRRIFRHLGEGSASGLGNTLASLLGHLMVGIAEVTRHRSR